MIGVISDIHGNFPALSAVLNELETRGVTEIVSLGDVAGYHCMLNECADALRSKKIRNLLGNHDDYLVNNKPCPRSNSVNRTIAWQRGIVTEENLRWLAASEDHFDEPRFYAVHAGPCDPLDEYVESFRFPKGIRQNLFFTGHTHKQQLERRGEKIWCNPGSVGQPRDGDPRAAYAILHENSGVELCRVPYDIDAVANAMRAAGFDEPLFKGLYFGKPVGYI